MLKEELRNEQGHYQHFADQGHHILENIADRDSSDAELISQRLDAVNATWDTLSKQLADRETSLNDVLETSTKFQETLKTLVEWLPLAAESVDALAAQTPAEQREQLKVCDGFYVTY